MEHFAPLAGEFLPVGFLHPVAGGVLAPGLDSLAPTAGAGGDRSGSKVLSSDGRQTNWDGELEANDLDAVGCRASRSLQIVVHVASEVEERFIAATFGEAFTFAH